MDWDTVPGAATGTPDVTVNDEPPFEETDEVELETDTARVEALADVC